MGQESKYGKFSQVLRDSALRRLAVTANVSELCREPGISRQQYDPRLSDQSAP